MKQQLLFTEKTKIEFGGSLSVKGKRKTARPLSFKKPIHLVLKAEGQIQLFRWKTLIRSQAAKFNEKFGIKIFSMAIHEDHVHLIVKIFSRKLYCAWIRGLTGTLNRKILGLKWKLLPYTKIISWGRQLSWALKYLNGNILESEFLQRSWEALSRFESDLSRRSCRMGCQSEAG